MFNSIQSNLKQDSYLYKTYADLVKLEAKDLGYAIGVSEGLAASASLGAFLWFAPLSAKAAVPLLGKFITVISLTSPLAVAAFVITGGVIVALVTGAIAAFACYHFSMRSIIKPNDAQYVKNKDVVLVLTATADHNGAFSTPEYQASTTLYKQKHTQIIERTVSSIEEIATFLVQIKNQNNRIKGLLIRAHGDPHTCCLGEYWTQNISNVNKFKDLGHYRYRNIEKLQGPLQLLEKNAVIILMSCSTGKIESGKQNIAQTLAQLAPGRTVIAPEKPISANETSLEWKDKKINVVFEENGINLTKIFQQQQGSLVGRKGLYPMHPLVLARLSSVFVFCEFIASNQMEIKNGT